MGTEPLIGGEDEQHFQTLADSQNAAASGNQVDDEDDQRDDQQKVDQAAGDVKAEAQKPQNHKNDDNCPKHIQHLSRMRTPETRGPAQAHATHSRLLVTSKQWPAPLRL